MGFDFPQTALVKKIFIHSSQYDSCHLKDQTSIPVKPDIFQFLFQPLRLFIQLHGSCKLSKNNENKNV